MVSCVLRSCQALIKSGEALFSEPAQTPLPSASFIPCTQGLAPHKPGPPAQYHRDSLARRAGEIRHGTALQCGAPGSLDSAVESPRLNATVHTTSGPSLWGHFASPPPEVANSETPPVGKASPTGASIRADEAEPVAMPQGQPVPKECVPRECAPMLGEGVSGEGVNGEGGPAVGGAEVVPPPVPAGWPATVELAPAEAREPGAELPPGTQILPGEGAEGLPEESTQGVPGEDGEGHRHLGPQAPGLVLGLSEMASWEDGVNSMVPEVSALHNDRENSLGLQETASQEAMADVQEGEGEEREEGAEGVGPCDGGGED